MRIVGTLLGSVLILEPEVFSDARGSFLESYNRRDFTVLTGSEAPFVQDNHSTSRPWVLRGIHYQIVHPQGKLVRCVAGAIFDVTVDLRCSSPTFGQWASTRLNANNRRQVWIPPGFGHGFLALESGAEVLYKTTAHWSPAHERTLKWNDPQLAIPWPIPPGAEPIISVKDQAGVPLDKAQVYEGLEG